jgi:hypothetical protein
VDHKAVEFILQLSYLLPVCSYVGVTTIRLSHDLINDEFITVSADVKLLNPKFWKLCL